ncbi:hypothetical protein BGZ60DRAFT_431558 [Tricladium varicosporioides]|nr:hypothetical protein BGZ60DRAFT_431558 [Hymenoscyphus varicosporioides]
MAPFPVVYVDPVLELQPRQNSHQITLTVTRSTTTYTTIIELGQPTNVATQPIVGSDPTMTASPGPAATNQLVTPRTDGGDSGVVAGALIGSVFGFMLILFLLYRWCMNRQYSSWSSYDSSYGSSRSESSFTDDDGSYIRHRGGGGPDWERRHGHVRRPRRAKTRKHRCEMSESDWSGTGSRSTRSRKLRRRDKSDAFLWWWGRPSGAGKRDRKEREWRRNTWAEGRARISVVDD